MFSKIKIFNSRISPFSQMKRRSRDFKTPIESILNDSSLQFVLRPIKSSHVLAKLIWIVSLSIFLSLTLFLCYSNIKSYLKYEVTTSIYEVVEKEPEFPTISFCNELIKYSAILNLYG